MTDGSREFAARALIAGDATGPGLVLSEPLSLWGGLDPTSGEIIDRRHPQSGQIVTAKVLVLPAGRGSSSASSVLLEAVRVGTAPAAIVLAELDAILALGAAVARELYDLSPPVVVVEAEGYAALRTGMAITISRSGRVRVEG